MEDNSKSLADLIKQEIAAQGSISLARFMEVALYWPGLGYYERPRPIGRRGDFFTSVSVGPLFGQLLAFQFAQWVDADSPDGSIHFIEAGPHDGKLAADILDWTSRHRPDLFARLEYGLLDDSPIRRAWQKETLQPWLSKVKWFSGADAFAQRQIKGIIFSNEFLDALPVHRLVWNSARQRWLEARVAMKGAEFGWEFVGASNKLAGHLPPLARELAAVLPDGFTVDVCPAAPVWWRRAANILDRGKLVTIDYGLTTEEILHPGRAQGTLRAFSRHHLSADILSQPGQQDLTAHVNFSALVSAGNAEGLTTEFFGTQEKFLTDILALAGGKADVFGSWDGRMTRQFQTLAHPEHLGRKFRALVQSR